MKKTLLRFVCVVIVAVMAITSAVTLTSCKKESGSAVSSMTVKTVSLRGIKEEGTTDEAIALVQDAMNKITKSLYNIQVVLELSTADDYFAELDEAMAIRDRVLAQEAEASKAEASKKASIAAQSRAEAASTSNNGHWVKSTTAESSTVEVQKTIIDENGKIQVIYPELEQGQIDIVFLSGYGTYGEYIESKLLKPLDEYLTGNYKYLNKYINSIFLNAAVQNGATYAILNSHNLGSSRYLVVNKALAEKYGLKETDITTLDTCVDLIKSVKASEKGYVPFYADDTSVPAYAYLFGEEYGLGGYIPAKTASDVAIRPTSIYAEENKYTKHLIAINDLKRAGCLSTSISENDKYAVGLITSNEVAVKALAEENYVVLLESPMAKKSNLFTGMYGISSYSKNADAAMQIISLLNTNEEYRNLYQYGIEGIHYELTEEGKVHRLKNDYMMDIEKTGNVFLAHPEEYMTADEIEIGKAQNVIAVRDPYFGFTYNTDTYAADIQNVKVLAKSIYDGFLTAGNASTYLANAAKTMADNESYKKLVNTSDSSSFLNEYLEWQKATLGK